MGRPDPQLPLSGHAIAAVVVGGFAIVASGPLLGIAVALHQLYVELHHARYEAGALAATSVLLAAVPFSAWALVRARRASRAGLARGEGLAKVGLGMTVAGFLLPFVGLLLFAGIAIVAVVAAWLSSLV